MTDSGLLFVYFQAGFNEQEIVNGRLSNLRFTLELSVIFVRFVVFLRPVTCSETKDTWSA